MDDVSGTRTFLIIVDPGPRHPAETGTYNHIHTSIKARFEKWWHHIPNVYIINADITTAEVYNWLNRVWPVPDQAHNLSASTASHTSSILVFDITNAENDGRLSDWTWLKNNLKQ